MKNNIYDVTIIGLGNIGLLYDLEEESNSEVFLSHTRSVFSHKNFEIKYLIDIDPKKLSLAKKKYGDQIEYKTELGEDYLGTDIVVLASIPSVNSYYLNRLKSIDLVKIFLIEKPFLIENEKVKDYYKIIEKSYLNYFRKTLPFFKNLKKEIDNKLFGNLITINIYYTKGLINNGSHLIDLLNYFFGSNYDLNSIKIIKHKNDYSLSDKSVSFCVNYNYNQNPFLVIFNCLDERIFNLIELDMIFEKQRFRIFDSGSKIQTYKLNKNKAFKKYKTMSPTKLIDSKLNTYGKHIYDTIRNIINGKEENNSTLLNENDVKVLRDAVIDKINEK